jgi:hypothetical protein
MASRCLCLALVFTLGCGSEWSPPMAPGQAFSARILPLADPSEAPNVLQLRIDGTEQRSALSDFRLFSGALSAYHLGRVAARQIPSTLGSREVPIAVWMDGDAVAIAPTRSLELDVHTLVTPELGRVLELNVAKSVPLLERTWPPPEFSVGVGPSIYCGDISGVATGSVALPPAGVPAMVEAAEDAVGSWAERCVVVSLAAKPPPGTLLLPPMQDGIAFDPAPLRYEPAAAQPAPCTAQEIAVGGPVCAEIADDRVEFRAFGGPALLSLTAPEPWAAVVASGGSVVLRGLEPATAYRLSGRVFDLGSGAHVFAADVTTLAPRPHLVIDEVLADPGGVERTSEWVELTNDGGASVSLLGMTFEDVGGSVALPDVLVGPGQRVLLVDDAFAPDGELDIVPDASTPLLRLATLGKGGLSNQGELLRLRDASGAVVSRFPAGKSARAGQSLARRTPDAPDDDPASFGPHLEPGASPGMPNAVEP